MVISDTANQSVRMLFTALMCTSGSPGHTGMAFDIPSVTSVNFFIDVFLSLTITV